MSCKTRQLGLRVENSAPKNKERKSTGGLLQGLMGRKGGETALPHHPCMCPGLGRTRLPQCLQAWIPGQLMGRQKLQTCHPLPTGLHHPISQRETGPGPRARPRLPPGPPLPQAPVPAQPHESDVHRVPGPRPPSLEGLGGKGDPEDINKYGQAVPGGSWFSPSWEKRPGLAHPEGLPLPSASLVAAPGGHDPVVGCVSSPLAPQEAGGARAGRACP